MGITVLSYTLKDIHDDEVSWLQLHWFGLVSDDSFYQYCSFPINNTSFPFFVVSVYVIAIFIM